FSISSFSGVSMKAYVKDLVKMFPVQKIIMAGEQNKNLETDLPKNVTKVTNAFDIISIVQKIR
ncbi:MAG: hypothetical protein P1P88_21550, partial [Bacteroidales bacterium]|nr:hypothetical protein [Bacteroidales bacterium]